MKTRFFYLMLSFMLWGNYSLLDAEGPPEKSQKNRKKYYEVVYLDKKRVKLISHIHLIPPGSRLTHENIKFEDIGTLPVKADLKKDAWASIAFFEKKLKEEVGPRRQLSLQEALFNVYQDFMGNYTTDMIYMTYNFTEPLQTGK
ncbi:MAG: hypothetical protein Q8P24_08085 [Desulfobacterales bacterium]|nr:hypothetical protein [Desulfobacterales bacterium]